MQKKLLEPKKVISELFGIVRNVPAVDKEYVQQWKEDRKAAGRAPDNRSNKNKQVRTSPETGRDIMDSIGGMEMTNNHINVRADFLKKTQKGEELEGELECKAIDSAETSGVLRTAVGSNAGEETKADRPKLVNIHDIGGGRGKTNEWKR